MMVYERNGMLSLGSKCKLHFIWMSVGVLLNLIQYIEGVDYGNEYNRQRYMDVEPKPGNNQNNRMRGVDKSSIYYELKQRELKGRPRRRQGGPQNGQRRDKPMNNNNQQRDGRGPMRRGPIRRNCGKRSANTILINQATYDTTNKMYGYVNESENYQEIVEFDPRGVFSCAYKKNSITLTYDDGPSEFTAQLLDILARENVKATFFVLGERLKESRTHQELLKRIYREGHTIASHGWSHTDFRTLSSKKIQEELQNTSTVIYRLIGVYPIYFRPPYGYLDERVKSVVFNMGFKIVTWNLDCRDWDVKNRSPSEVLDELKNILKHFQPVQKYKSWIFLQHDIHKTTVDIQQEVIRIFKSYGYQFLTLQGCVGINCGPYA